MLIPDSTAVITKVGDLLKIVYNGSHPLLMKYTKNVITNQEIGLIKMDKGIETTLLCDELTRYTHMMFDTINGVEITSNMILFNELEKML